MVRAVYTSFSGCLAEPSIAPIEIRSAGDSHRRTLGGDIPASARSCSNPGFVRLRMVPEQQFVAQPRDKRRHRPLYGFGSGCREKSEGCQGGAKQKNGRLVAKSTSPFPAPFAPSSRSAGPVGQGSFTLGSILVGVRSSQPLKDRSIQMQVAVQLNTGRDYAIAAVVLVIIAIALMLTAYSARTALTGAVS